MISQELWNSFIEQHDRLIECYQHTGDDALLEDIAALEIILGMAAAA